ncbi:MAG: glycosyl transferase family 1 [Chloroflexi bacterium RBG_16_57_8]|nr:MAG: glycosyl transferase family 1 [Chloroflexi bacterium RBG_16_57_8]
MKIALVSPYDFAHPGGVVTHITNLYQHLVGMGLEVKIIAPTSDVIDVFGNHFIRIGKPRPIPVSESISRVPISLNLGPEIKAVLAREKFDIIHLHEPFAPMLCSAVLRFSDAKNVGTFHAADGKPGYNLGWPIGRMILRRRRRKLDGRIAVSKPAMQYASKYVPGEYTIIPNGTDVRYFNPNVRPIEKFCDDKLNIVFVSRLERRKGVDYLLPAFQEVKSQIPDSRLLIVGHGTRLRKGYEDWVRKQKLEDVVFVGGVSYAELPGYFRTGDVFCVPATGRESQGAVLLEAMATGRPVVATNIDGYATVVTHGEQGLLVPPRDSHALAEALVKLLRDEPLRRRMGEKGLARAQEFSWDVVARRVVEYYRKMLNGHQTSAGGTGDPPTGERTSEMPEKGV